MIERLKQVRRKLEKGEADNFSKSASLSSQAIRRHPDLVAETGFRLDYALDGDRILHSLAFTRYIDKTQVFSLMDNEHITHRVVHVQLVSKIARTVGALLGLNADLLEAIALAHDIGHAPFGHDGERFLSAKCQENGLGYFQHNLQGVHVLERLEGKGRGLNLSLQVLDGVLAHDGEALINNLWPDMYKDFFRLDEEIALKSQDPDYAIYPFTLEGCVVRLADSIAYVGRDLEDAILVGLIKREHVPAEVMEILGDSNGTIVYRLVEDLVATSYDKPWVGFSDTVREALLALKQFNYSNIYTNPLIRSQHAKIEELFYRMFDNLLEDVRRNNMDSPIFRDFLDNMHSGYLQEFTPPVFVRDFIASMTDQYFLDLSDSLLRPMRLPKRFAQK